MNFRAGVAGMALATALSACLLAVDFADAGGAHCRFAGSGTTCGQCLADHCAPMVDACCFDDHCGGVIGDLESCATQSGAGCTHLADSTDRGGAHTALSECVAKECANACAPPAHNQTSCHASYVTAVEACQCEIGATPNDTTCTEVGHPALRCCAPEGWPGPVRTCECKKIICVSAGDGCLCELGPMDDRARPTECTGQFCCYDPKLVSCACGSVACRPEETQVTSCTIAPFGCPTGQHHVDTCNVPKP
jgi:hypothetical protein